MPDFRKMKQEKGQIALVVLLISAVVMTVGLSVAKKTTVDTKIETDEEQLKQAFNAAESGIEYYMGTGKTNFTAVDNVSKANVTVTNIGSGSTVNFDQYTLVNSNQNYWLTAHNPDGTINTGSAYGGSTLDLCVDAGFAGALKVDYFYLDGGSYLVKRYGYNLSAGFVSGFTDLTPSQGSCSSGYEEINLGTPLSGMTPLLLTVKPLRTGTKMYLLGDGSVFPVQGISLTSQGQAGQAATSVSRTLKLVRIYQIPSFMIEAVTSYGSVLSN